MSSVDLEASRSEPETEDPSSDGAPSSSDGAASRKRLDVTELRHRLDGQNGPEFWRSLEELAETPEFEAMVHREFPQQASEWLDDVSRRRFLQLMSASLAFGGMAACTRQPLEKIVPYVNQPEQIVPGRPLYFATSTEIDGYALGLLAESHMGRPTKIEGNPEHPASLGATDLYAQAEVLNLYDPDRAETVENLGRIRTWDDFASEIESVLEAQRALGGAGLRILTGTVTSPTLGGLLGGLMTEMPQARWVQYEPIGQASARSAARQAFGQPLATTYDFTQAKVVVALDADFLTDGPGAVRYSRDFARTRRVRSGQTKMSRLYSVESATSNTGTLADHRIPLSAAEVGHFATALAAKLGVPGVSAPSGFTSGAHAESVRAAAKDLKAARGASIVLAGRQAPTELHVLCHAINELLGNLNSTVLLTEPIEAYPAADGELEQLVADLNAGKVDTLLVLGGNPIFDAPADLEFKSAFLKAARRIRLGLASNETSEYCQWNLPEAHALESWGDSRAFDGTVTLRQPLIEPLYDGRSATEVVSMLTPDGYRAGDTLLKGQWQEQLGGSNSFEKAWRRAVHDGFVADSQAATARATVATGSVSRAAQQLSAQTVPSAGALEVVFRADPTIYDGRFANNSWLQECPKPLTKLTWDNAALISPALAGELGIKNEQVVRLEVDGRSLETAVWVHPGQPRYTVTLSLGYGRTRVGRVGTGTGFDTYILRSAATPWTMGGVTLTPTDASYQLASTQLHNNIEEAEPRVPVLNLPASAETNVEGVQAGNRHLIRTATVGHFESHPEFAQHVGHGIDESLSLYPEHQYKTYAWGLSIDLSSCTGCNACVIACQSENNVPIVGKEQVGNGREMHWIRIDRYYQGDMDAPEMHNQPVMCMHCEQAPCEVVCPVAATVHSDEGLNDMVYNRCVGTRYCSNNCPYKVRRFNFLKYNDTDTPVLDLMRNPDVTVRVRGVMEKCSYCVQRINKGRIEAKKERRKIRDGEVVTACQQACPTEAVVFGDLNDPESRAAKRKAQPLNYGLLTELGTRPRTTYMAKITNPSDQLAAQHESGAGGHDAGGHDVGGHGAGGHGDASGQTTGHEATSHEGEA